MPESLGLRKGKVPDRSIFFQTTRQFMKSRASYVGAGILTAVPAIFLFLLEQQRWEKDSLPFHLIPFAIFAVVWWWMLSRTFLLALGVFTDLRRLLTDTELAPEVNLHDEGNYFGFRGAVDYVQRFLGFFVFIGAGFLFVYQIVFHLTYADQWSFWPFPPKTITVAFSALIWIPYLCLPVYIFFCTIRPCLKGVREQRDQKLRKIAEGIAECEENGDTSRVEFDERQYDRLESINLARLFGVFTMLGMSIFQLLATAGSTFSSEIAKKISNLF